MLTELLYAVESVTAVVCIKVNIVVGKNYSYSVPKSLLVSCEDEDQPELPLCPPPGFPLCLLHL